MLPPVFLSIVWFLLLLKENHVLLTVRELYVLFRVMTLILLMLVWLHDAAESGGMRALVHASAEGAPVTSYE